MNYKLLFFLLFFYTSLSAHPISEREAMHRAMSFLSKLNTRSTSIKFNNTLIYYSPQHQPTLYAFNMKGNKGYIVVSADNRMPTILGFSEVGQLSTHNMPCALSVLLHAYSEEIAYIQKADVDAPLPAHTTHTPIAPLVKAQWSQLEPYNLQSPVINNVHAPTGCVATAMAQVMYTLRCPARYTTHPIPADSYEKHTTQSATMPQHPFLWNEMLPVYQQPYTYKQANAVAYLMRQCGAAVKTTYTLNGASAADISIVTALTQYFGFDTDAFLAHREDYTVTEWNNLMYNELAQRRPIIYVATSPTDGVHAFVCDGYLCNDFFHINWGWGGHYNGYFRLSVLSPYAQSTLGNTEGYTLYQTAVVGLQPEDYICNRPLLQIQQLDFSKYMAPLTSTASNDVPLPFSTFAMVNTLPQTVQAEVALVLMSKGDIAQVLYTQVQTLKKNKPIIFSKVPIHIKGSLLTPAHVPMAIVPLFRVKGESKWRKFTNTDAFITSIRLSPAKVLLRKGGDMPLAVPSLRVDSVRVLGSGIPHTPHYLQVFVSNSGGSFNGELSLYQSDTLLSKMGAYLSAHASDSVCFTFIPQQQCVMHYAIRANFRSLLYQGDINISPQNNTLIPLAISMPHSSSTITNDAWYNLSGQRISHPLVKGVYIHKQQKVYIRK